MTALPTTARRRVIATLSGLSVLTALAACSGDAAADEDEPAIVEQGGSTSIDADDSTPDDSAAYADGTYTASGSYQSPGGTESIDVELTLADGIVTAVEVTPQAKNATSKQFQAKFASGVAAQVVGQAIDSLDVTTVSGSSLTSGGFMAAVDQIESDAAA